MIRIEEILKGKDLKSLPKEEQDNLKELVKRMNVIREEWAKPMIVTSGYRSKSDHRRIYAEKGIPESKIPWGSQHLKGAACDISDPKGELWRWLLSKPDILKDAQLWCEDDPAVPRVHFQIFPPKSGKRFFKP